MDNSPQPISGEEIWRKLEAASDGSKKVCFIFGAGASYGHVPYAQYQAPIVKDLFDSSNPAVRAVLAKPEHEILRNNIPHYERQLRRYNNDLEAYLSAQYTGSRDDTLFAGILNYLQDIFFLVSSELVQTDNCYMALVNQIVDLNRSKSWSYITFNYDTLFEKSYLAAGRDPIRKAAGFPSLESYREVRPLILKMHGSINYRFKFLKQYLRTDQNNPKYSIYNLFIEMMDNAEESDFSKSLEIIDPSAPKPDAYSTAEKFNPNRGRNEVSTSIFNFPLMLIPIHGSIDPENPFFQEMIDRAKVEIEEASIIVSIGYNFGDKSFTNKLADLDFSNKEIILVDRKPDMGDLAQHRGIKNIQESWSNSNIFMFDGEGFKGFIDALG